MSVTIDGKDRHRIRFSPFSPDLYMFSVGQLAAFRRVFTLHV